MQRFYLLLIYLLTTFLAFGLSNLCVFEKFWMDGRAYPPLLIYSLVAAILTYFFTNQKQINLRMQFPQLLFKQFEFLFVFAFLVLVYWFAVNSENYYKEGILLFFLFTYLINTLFTKLYINLQRKTIKTSPFINTLLIGNSTTTDFMKDEVESNHWLGFTIKKQIKKFPKTKADFEKIITENNIKSIFVELDSVALTKKEELFLKDLSENLFIKPYAFSSTLGKNLARGSYMLVGTTQLVPIFNYPLDSIYNRLVKRAFDILFTIIITFFVFIWLFPLLAILIIIDSGFPVFFNQKRHGLDNSEFNCYKFRTMVVNKESNSKTTKKGDPRITRIGRILRKTSIDEFPQFWNILIGDMSLVGPRPHMVSQNMFYDEIIDKYTLRHKVKPGLTGLAQVRGFRGEINTNQDMENRIDQDIRYIRNWSFFLDLKIIFLTILKIVKGDENAI